MSEIQHFSHFPYNVQMFNLVEKLIKHEISTIHVREGSPSVVRPAQTLTEKSVV